MSVADDWRKRFAVVLIGAVCIGVVAWLLGHGFLSLPH